MNPDAEILLKNLRWREPSQDIMRRTLDHALEVRRDATSEHSRRRVWHRPILLAALAACWLLSLFFRLATPEALPASTMAAAKRLTPGESAELIASVQERQRIAEWLLAHLERRGRPATATSPTRPILP